MGLSLDEKRRYARHLQLDDFGDDAQTALKKARVLVVGAGGLGAPVISYLAAAGIGTLGILDFDRVELSNLQRQIAHETGDIGRLKAESARDRAEELNPEIRVIPIAERLEASNALQLLEGYDVIVDGSDSFSTRFHVNQACFTLGIPLISGAVKGWEGHVASFAPHMSIHAPCYACLVAPDAPEINTCREAGVIGPLCGIIGSMQALEVVHTITSSPRLLGKLLLLDGRDFSQRIVTIPRDPSCSVCHARVD
ncbi:MAG: molybdopterin biosynthesis protein MoeB [Alphaproteobacteria bacterium]|nr:molybdopterin biosynthesis protein MoeB [Alphaproteobacteria bacterium]